MTPLFDQLRSLELPAGDFAIFGSGPLIVRGIIPASNDLDVICRGIAWERVKAAGRVEYLSDYDLCIVTMCDGRLTFGRQWAIGAFDTDELIESADTIIGLPFVQLQHVESYKKIGRRPKDLDHLAALRAFLDQIQAEHKAQSLID